MLALGGCPAMKRLVLALVAVVLCTGPALAGTCGSGSHTIVGLSSVQYEQRPCILVQTQTASPCANCPGMRPYSQDRVLYCLQPEQHTTYSAPRRHGRCGPLALTPPVHAVPPAAVAPPAAPPHLASVPSAPAHFAPAPPPPHVSAPVRTVSAPTHSAGGSGRP